MTEQTKKSVLDKSLFILILIFIFAGSGFISYGALANTTVYRAYGSKISWNIKIDKVVIKETYGSAVQKSLSYNGTSINFNVDFEKPGDYIIYTVYVKNSGVINAKLSSITGIDVANATFPNSIKYIVDSKQTSLKVNEINAIDVKVAYIIDNETLDKLVNSSKLATINFNYIQE